MNSDFDVVPVRPYPSTLGLIGTSKLACHESNAWRASHDSKSYTIAGSQLLTSKWGMAPLIAISV